VYNIAMRRILAITAIFILTVSFTGCASLGHRQTLPPYSGLKARIAVADFEVRATKATSDIGAGLRELLVAALAETNRFQIVAHQPLNSGTPEVKPADLIISIAVTEFEPEASSGKGGIGGGGSAGSNALGALLGAALNKARIALDIRIINASTSEVLTSTLVQGQASDVGSAGPLVNWSLGSGLSVYSNTPMEKAMRICLAEAVRYITQNIPQEYYKY